MDRGAWQATQSMGSKRVGHGWVTNTHKTSCKFLISSQMTDTQGHLAKEIVPEIEFQPLLLMSSVGYFLPKNRQQITPSQSFIIYA